MKCVNRAGSSLSGLEGQQLFNHLPSPTRALPSSPTDQTVLVIEPPSTPPHEQGPFQYSPSPERDLSLDEHRTSRCELGIGQDSSCSITHAQNRSYVEPLPLSHSSRQSPAARSSHTTESTLQESSPPGTLSRIQQSMGNDISTILRKSRSKIFREAQADSPETSVSIVIPLRRSR